MRRIVPPLVLLAVGLPLVAAPAAAGPDRKPPRVTFTTPEDAVLVGPPTPTEAGQVRGRATDRRSGVRKVVVTFCPGSRTADGGWTCGSDLTDPRPIVSRRAALSCANGKKRSCDWAAPAPIHPGRWLVFAAATDRAGNERSRGPLQILVV